jgi:hypothetical protein
MADENPCYIAVTETAEVYQHHRDLHARLLAAERERDEAVLNAHSYASQILEAQVAANEAEAQRDALAAALRSIVYRFRHVDDSQWMVEARAALKKADHPPAETRGG